MYTIRRVGTYKRKLNCRFIVEELPELVAYTNFYEYVKKAFWKVEYKSQFQLCQTNELVYWTNFIPIINCIVNYLQHRKYALLRNGIIIGHSDQVIQKGIGNFHYVIDGKEYYTSRGNASIIRPGKSYEWFIKSDSQTIASIKTPDKKVYYMNVLSDELELPLLVMAVMMVEAHWFSGELSDIAYF